MMESKIADILYGSLHRWPEAERNYANLGMVQKRTLTGCAKMSPAPTVMFNPGRVRSTTAKVDAAAIGARKCFLCHANRPEVQSFIEYGEYHILANPFPIFQRHLTIANACHIPQDIRGRMSQLCRFATSLPNYVVFFNGACCGASAPDHMHFQAVAGEDVPTTFLDSCAGDCDNVIFSSEDGSVAASECTGRLVYILRPTRSSTADALFESLCSSRRIDCQMVNILARTTRLGSKSASCPTPNQSEDLAEVEIFVIPRRAFRPWQFTAEGNALLLVSPASVEVCGTFVVPDRKTFDKITTADADDILSQVCYAHDSELTI